MRQSVRDIFLEFSTRYTACVPWMYLDSQGMVRTAIHCSLEPIDNAFALPWVSKDDGRKSELNEVSADWVRVKKQRNLVHLGPNRARFIAQLELTKDGIELATNRQLDAYLREIVTVFPTEAWESYPANVQLAIMSMVWMLGGTSQLGFNPSQPNLYHFVRAIHERAWASAAENCFLDETQDPKLKPRNWANRKLLSVAAKTEELEKVTGWP